MNQQINQEVTEESARVPQMRPLKAASEETGLSYTCLRKMCLQGRIAFIRSGNKYFVNMDYLANYLNRAGG